MKIILEKSESEKIFHGALCNGGGLAYCGVKINYSDKEYAAAKKSLQKKTNDTVCLEDVWLEILRRGGTLTMIDEESGMKPASIKLSDVHRRVAKTEPRHLMDAINEQDDDAITAEVILQTVFYGKVIFG
jgi:hypothetical protein